jgi:hypothetical protein
MSIQQGGAIVIRRLLALTAAVAGATVLLALLLAGGGSAHAQGMHGMRGMRMLSTNKVVALHETMDKLWTDHTTWTRLVIIDFLDSRPDLGPDLARLLRNQVDIGNAIKPYYGRKAGRKLTRLLKTHIELAVPVLQAAKDGDQDALKTSLSNWYANAHQIAVFLSKANRHNWPLGATSAMMKRHLKLTTNEAVEHLQGHWKADIRAYDKVRSEILMMADTLAGGIVQQFPHRFS